MASDIEKQLAVQLRRIEGLHRGFLYQHLFAVGCLLLGAKAGVQTVAVERDEDVELQYGGRRRYIQVKTRTGILQRNDVEGAVTRFRNLLSLHEDGSRSGDAEFWLVSNAALSGPALECLRASSLPITLHTPADTRDVDGMPPAWPALGAAVEWSKKEAETVPFTRLAPETLVWKLASEVAWACTGARPQGHEFDVNALEELFEQFVTTLQHLPAAPDLYRAQIAEPLLNGDAPIRLIVGLSGAGKTSWAAVHALHANSKVVYFDTTGNPSGAVPSALARELAAQVLVRGEASSTHVFMPGATGLDSLRLLAGVVRRTGTGVVLICDNAQAVDVDVLRHMTEATVGCQWIFLARPWPGVAVLTAHLHIEAERLEGFSLEDIAAEFQANDVVIDLPTADRVRHITGGLPLFVRDSAKLAAQRYAADARAFCDAVESRANPYVHAQDIIVHDVVNNLAPDVCALASVLALSELPLSRGEAIRLTTAAVPMSPASATAALRDLIAWGVAQVSLTGELSVHDAFRGTLADFRERLAPDIIDRGYRTLGDVLVKSFGPGQFDRLVQFCKIAPRIGKVQTLIDISSDFSEQLQERGKAEELIRIIEDAANDQTLPSIERFWAADTVAFWRIWRSEDDAAADIGRLASLLASVPSPPRRAIANLEVKQLLLAGRRGDLVAVRHHFARALMVAESSLARRIVRYDYAVALHQCGAHQLAMLVCGSLARDYFAHFRMGPEDLFMKSNPALQAILGNRAKEFDELKRFADVLQLSALASNALDRPAGLVGIWAHKLYLLAWAPQSAIRAGMDVVDELLGTFGDAVGARDFLERNLIPTVSSLKLLAFVAPVQAQLAVVLAYCGNYESARRSIKELQGLAADEHEKFERDRQARLIEQIAARGRPLKRMPAPSGSGPVPMELVALPERARNDACFCDSGLKYKQCCGRRDQ